MSISFRSAYSPSVRVSVSFPSVGLTKQSFKNDADINVIMSRYLRTGVLPETVQQIEARFADVSEIDYQRAMELCADANSLFMELPSNVRSRFDNDPGAFLAFTSDPKNREEMGAMGLLEAGWDVPVPAPSGGPADAPAASPAVPKPSATP